MDFGSLSASFRLAAGEVQTQASDGVDPALEEVLADSCARGRAAHPLFRLDDRAFVRYLAEVTDGERSPAAIRALAVEDLYLACACLAGNQQALPLFHERHGKTIRGAIARIVGATDVDELEQGLMEMLLVGSETHEPRLRRYAGKAPVDRWLGVSAHRAALRWQRDNRTETRARRGIAAQPVPLGLGPEREFAKELYRADLERALAEALDHLSQRSRALLRLHIVNGVSVDKIGKMYSVSQSTASRWLADARQSLLDDIKANFHERFRMPSSEVGSLVDLIASRLDLSLSALLQSR